MLLAPSNSRISRDSIAPTDPHGHAFERGATAVRTNCVNVMLARRAMAFEEVVLWRVVKAGLGKFGGINEIVHEGLYAPMGMEGTKKIVVDWVIEQGVNKRFSRFSETVIKPL